MSFISDTDRQNISDAIKSVEKQTTGEMVCVIAQSSDNYYYIPTLWAAIISLVAPGLVFIVGGYSSVEHLILSQLSLCVLLTIIFQFSSFKYRLVPKAVRYHRAARTAREQFFEQNLHRTKDNTGLLIFVSVAERYVEILADVGINEKVEAGYWQPAIETFVSAVKAGQTAKGFSDTIEYCGKALIEHFPAEGENPNELPDHLIEI